MLLRRKGVILSSLLALTAVFLFGSALQARPPLVGQVTLTQATTLDGRPVKAQTTVFSGDTLAVGEGVAVLVFGSGSQIRLGSDTVASFVKEGDAITVQLEKGIVSISSAKDGLIKVTATGVEITPVGGFKTIGHIAMLGATPGSLSVTAREGSLKISRPGSNPVTVTSGSTITIRTQAAAGAPAPQGGSGGALAAAGAPAPQGGSGGALAAAAVALSGGALITSAVAASKAGDDDATSAATAAYSAATAAYSAANAASSAANAASSAANAATASADAVGTTVDTLVADLCNEQVIPSPGADSCGP